jgi:glucose-1-phosphate thymidylyltransferase
VPVAVDRNAYPRPVGVVPAAGQARRLSPLPVSKEVFPVGFHRSGGGPAALRPKPVCHYLLEQMYTAGVQHVFIVIRSGKWDIPACLGDGGRLGLRLAYLVAEDPLDAVTTVAQATPFVRDDLVVFGFPDIISRPVDAFRRLRDRQAASHADIVLGLFPAEQPRKVDMVDVERNGRVREIVVKPPRTELSFTWVGAVWTPRFTEFLDGWHQRRAHAHAAGELHVGQVIQAAIDAGQHADSVVFPEGSCIDVGTPEDLARAVHMFADPGAAG